MPVSLLFEQLAETDKRIKRLTDEIGGILRAKRDKPASGYDPRRGHATGDDHCGDVWRSPAKSRSTLYNLMTTICSPLLFTTR